MSLGFSWENLFDHQATSLLVIILFVFKKYLNQEVTCKENLLYIKNINKDACNFLPFSCCSLTEQELQSHQSHEEPRGGGL